MYGAVSPNSNGRIPNHKHFYTMFAYHKLCLFNNRSAVTCSIKYKRTCWVGSLPWHSARFAVAL